MAGTLANVWLAPLTSRLTKDMPDHKDYFYVLSVGAPFEYVIPGFDLLAVDLREMRVQGYDDEGQLRVLDVFARADPSLNRVYPAQMEVTDQSCVEVSSDRGLVY